MLDNFVTDFDEQPPQPVPAGATADKRAAATPSDREARADLAAAQALLDADTDEADTTEETTPVPEPAEPAIA